MPKNIFRALSIAAVLGLAAAQSQAGAYQQCGGNGHSGPTTCVSGFTCSVVNEWYHQCVPGSSGGNPNPNPSPNPGPSTSVRPTTTSSANNPGPTFPGGGSGATGVGKTTRYWDCCKPSCSWPGKGPVSNPVRTCNKDNQVIADSGAPSGCEPGGYAYMCSDQQPWAVSDDLAYGFAAVSIAGQGESNWCCSCYELTFIDGPASGKRMIVQATNTGSDLGNNHFDIAMPGGGVGIFNACSNQYNAPTDGWGQRYGGVSSRDQCSVIPPVIRNGCQWRWDWWNGSDNPQVRFREVQCPSELTSKTGCVRR